MQPRSNSKQEAFTSATFFFFFLSGTVQGTCSFTFFMNTVVRGICKHAFLILTLRKPVPAGCFERLNNVRSGTLRVPSSK